MSDTKTAHERALAAVYEAQEVNDPTINESLQTYLSSMREQGFYLVDLGSEKTKYDVEMAMREDGYSRTKDMPIGLPDGSLTRVTTTEYKLKDMAESCLTTLKGLAV